MRKGSPGNSGRIYPWGSDCYENRREITTTVGLYSSIGDSLSGCVDMARGMCGIGVRICTKTKKIDSITGSSFDIHQDQKMGIITFCAVVHSTARQEALAVSSASGTSRTTGATMLVFEWSSPHSSRLWCSGALDSFLLNVKKYPCYRQQPDSNREKAYPKYALRTKNKHHLCWCG